MVNGKKTYTVRASFNKKLIDLSGICVIEDSEDYFQCPYEAFKAKMAPYLLQEGSDQYCGAAQLPYE